VRAPTNFPSQLVANVPTAITAAVVSVTVALGGAQQSSGQPVFADRRSLRELSVGDLASASGLEPPPVNDPRPVAAGTATWDYGVT